MDFEGFVDLQEIADLMKTAQADDGYDKLSIEIRTKNYGDGMQVITLQSANPYTWKIEQRGEIKFDGPDRRRVDMSVYLPSSYDQDMNRIPVDHCSVSNEFLEKESFLDTAWKYFYSMYFTPQLKYSFHEVTTAMDPIELYKIKTNAYYNHYDGIVDLVTTPRYAYSSDPAEREECLRQAMRKDFGEDFVNDVKSRRFDHLRSYDDVRLDPYAPMLD